MAYRLGVDLGTTFTAAAVHHDNQVKILPLATDRATVPSVVAVRDDGSVVVGAAAERRAMTEPERIAREFKRRLGDPTPIFIAGTPRTAQWCTARVLEWVVQAATERQGEPPARVAVTHPANWRSFKTDLLIEAIGLAGLDPATTVILSEPEAAAMSYAASAEVAEGEIIAVYDLGGGTFDAAVLRRDRTGFQILGAPEGVERLGGIDFDAALFDHVVGALSPAYDGLDSDDGSAMLAVARLRHDCTEAKEALSFDTDTAISVVLPNRQREVRVVRQELEALIRPGVVASIDALRRALRSAGVEAGDLARVLLVGGSSRIPLVAQMLASELGRPTITDLDPKDAVAIGAAYAAAGTHYRTGGESIRANAGFDLPTTAVPSGSEAPPARTSQLAAPSTPPATPGEQRRWGETGPQSPSAGTPPLPPAANQRSTPPATHHHPAQPGTGQPGTGQPGTGQPGTGQPAPAQQPAPPAGPPPAATHDLPLPAQPIAGQPPGPAQQRPPWDGPTADREIWAATMPPTPASDLAGTGASPSLASSPAQQPGAAAVAPVSATAAHPVGPAAGGAGRRTRTLFIAVAAGVAAVAVGGGLLLRNLLSDEPTEATADPAGQAAPALWPGSLTVAIAAEDAGGNGQATLATILEGELGIEVDVVQRNDKVSVAEALADQEAALGILDPYVYVGATGSGAAIRPAGVEASTSADDGIARTYGLTRAGSSTIGSLADVGDQVVCFPDRTSLEGYQFPMAGLLAAGIDPGSLRSEVAGSYEAAIEFAIDGTCPVAFASEAAVADLIASGALSGVVDGTGEGDDVNPEVAEVTIIWKSDPITSDPIVVGTWLPPDLQDQIVEIVTQKANRDWADANGYCTAASPCVVNGSDGWGYAAATDADFNGYRQLCQLPDIDRCDQ